MNTDFSLGKRQQKRKLVEIVLPYFIKQKTNATISARNLWEVFNKLDKEDGHRLDQDGG
ncbi:MAG: hypothetical protein HQK56_06565 [Deltaproteobacteria bacterium]|nr:hypothetical protein [Deltaproteobacteria bacterium]